MNFWYSKEAIQYQEYATLIPSDLVAYEVLYSLFDTKDKLLLDFGCFQGNSSFRLLKSGASAVVGVDSVSHNIVEAKKEYVAEKKSFFFSCGR